MSAGAIVTGLERSNATGAEAAAIARLGFLEWVFVQPDQITEKMVSAALSEPELQNPESPAAKAFVANLEQALKLPTPKRSRRSGPRSRLH